MLKAWQFNNLFTVSGPYQVFADAENGLVQIVGMNGYARTVQGVEVLRRCVDCDREVVGDDVVIDGMLYVHPSCYAAREP